MKLRRMHLEDISHECKGKIPPGRVSDEDDVLGCKPNFRDQVVVASNGVKESGGERVDRGIDCPSGETVLQAECPGNRPRMS